MLEHDQALLSEIYRTLKSRELAVIGKQDICGFPGSAGDERTTVVGRLARRGMLIEMHGKILLSAAGIQEAIRLSLQGR